MTKRYLTKSIFSTAIVCPSKLNYISGDKYVLQKGYPNFSVTANLMLVANIINNQPCGTHYIIAGNQ